MKKGVRIEKLISPGTIFLFCSFIFRNARNWMKKSATLGFTKTGKPGLTWPTGSYALACTKSHRLSVHIHIYTHRQLGRGGAKGVNAHRMGRKGPPGKNC